MYGPKDQPPCKLPDGPAYWFIVIFVLLLPPAVNALLNPYFWVDGPLLALALLNGLTGPVAASMIVSRLGVESPRQRFFAWVFIAAGCTFAGLVCTAPGCVCPGALTGY